MVKIECVINKKNKSNVMGDKGVKVKGIKYEFGVKIKFNESDDKEEYNGKKEEGKRKNGDVEECEKVRMCDVIRINGKKEECEDDKREMMDLVNVNVEVDVRFDFKSYIIGKKGRDVREIMDRYDVNIVL